MDLGDIWDIVHAVLKKESRGNLITPDRFTSLLQQCHHEYYNQQYEKWAGSQALIDSLKPFTTIDGALTFAAGSVLISTLSNTYKHAIAARVSSDDTPIDIVTPKQWNDWIGDAVMVPTTTYPIMTQDVTKFYVYPTSITGVKMSYLVQCADVKFDKGTVNGTTLNQLEDDDQNFLTTVEAGMTVYNTTDGTTASVVSVDSNTTLTLDGDIAADSENYFVIQDDAATDYFLPFFDYYTDANYKVNYLANGVTYTLAASEVYRDGTSSGKVVGVSHELKWADHDKINIISLLLEKIGVSLQAPDIAQYAMSLEQKQNTM